MSFVVCSFLLFISFDGSWPKGMIVPLGQEPSATCVERVQAGRKREEYGGKRDFFTQ